MTFTLEINCDNAEFDRLAEEVGRILHASAVAVEEGVIEHDLVDFNGNHVGHFQFKGEQPQ